MHPRVVLLDALGTLVRLEPPAPRLRTELRERFGLSVGQAEAQRAIGAEIAYYRTHLHEGRDQTGLAALRRCCAQVLWRELSGHGESPEIGALVEALLASLRFTTFDDVLPALDGLQALGARLVVVSNWDVSLPEVLGRLGLTRHLDGVVTSAQAGVAKPDPEIFQRALKLAGALPEQALHVGDSLREDVAGARAAGIRAVLIVRERGGGLDTPPGEGVQEVSGLETPRGEGVQEDSDLETPRGGVQEVSGLETPRGEGVQTITTLAELLGLVSD